LRRAPIRGERPHRLYVSLGRIAELRHIKILDDAIEMGACASHAEVAAALGHLPECTGLVNAVLSAANPAIRQMATVGGNLCAGQFAAADVVPALLCLDAEVELHSRDGVERLPLVRFLMLRDHLVAGTLLVRVMFRRRQARCAHIRLPLRKAGDYPVAIVSAAVNLRPDGLIDDIRIAVGSVEPVASRWSRLELLLSGQPLDVDAIGSAAEAFVTDYTGRDGVEAEGWYRTQVLPTLVRRAVRDLLKQPRDMAWT
jgi:carbon-monoxide dehydrogenase medium subunit